MRSASRLEPAAEAGRRRCVPGARQGAGARARFDNLLVDMHRWLDAEVGRGNYAEHGATTEVADAIACYLRGVEDAQPFVARFPMLELADDAELRPSNPLTCRSVAALNEAIVRVTRH
jgi:hypothetical protein